MSSLETTRRVKVRDPRMVGLWRMGRVLGQGAYGRVRIARHACTQEYAAVKIIRRKTLSSSFHSSLAHALSSIDRDNAHFEREVVLMKLLRHINVLDLYDVWETEHTIYLILEYVEGGDLNDHIASFPNSKLPLLEAVHCFQQVIAGLDYCHRFGVVHRDLKPENILVDKRRNVKISDFGLAGWQPSRCAEDFLTSSCGSPHYAAPEILYPSYDGMPADIWSLGAILYYMITGRVPFDGDSSTDILNAARRGVFDPPRNTHASAVDMINRMLTKDVKRRITIPQIRSHPFFNLTTPKSLEHFNVKVPSEFKSYDAPVLEIDPGLLSNLCTLWYKRTQDEIVADLQANSDNRTKCVYYELKLYRENLVNTYMVYEEQEKEAKRLVAEKRKARKAEKANPPRAAPPTPRRARQGSDAVKPSGSAQSSPSPSSSSLSKQQDHIKTKPSIDENIFNFRPLPPLPETARFVDPNPKVFYRNTRRIEFASKPVLCLSNFPVDSNLPINALNLPTKARANTHVPAYNQILLDNDGLGLCGVPVGSPPPPCMAVDPYERTKPLTLSPRKRAVLGEVGNRDRRDQPEGTTLGNVNCHNQVGNGTTRSELSPSDSFQILADKGCIPNDPVYGKKGLLPLGTIGVRTAKLHKRKSAGSSTMGTPSSLATSQGGSSLGTTRAPASSIKRAWMPLPNVFRSKSTVCTLRSTADLQTTTNVCRKILMGMDVIVSHSANEAGAERETLQCRIDEAGHAEGLVPSLKPVSFRVEVTPFDPSSLCALPAYTQSNRGPDAAYPAVDLPLSAAVYDFQTTVTLVREKGAQESMRVICERVRREWALDKAEGVPRGLTPLLHQRGVLLIGEA